MILSCENLIKDDYTVESWTIFSERLAEAQNLLQQYYLTETDIDNVYNLLQNAFNSLKFGIYDGIHYDSKTNKKMLNYIINDCVLKNYH